MDQPTIDLNKAVENPKLLAAIESWHSLRTPQTEVQLVQSLNEAHYLLPANLERMQMSAGAQPGEVFFEVGSVLKLYMYEIENGDLYYPLFTDWSAIRFWTEKAVDCLVIPPDQAWGFILKDGKHMGAVLNPASLSFRIDRGFAARLSQALGKA